MAGMNPAEVVCDAVTKYPGMTNATAKVAAWLVGAAQRNGGFPIEVSVTQICDGMKLGAFTIAGTGSRPETIRAAINWLIEHQIIEATEGRPVGFGFKSHIYDMVQK
jgi:dihydroxyacid dehydratase/phosphogluconate dehydratase